MTFGYTAVTQSNMVDALTDKPDWIAAQGINTFYASAYGASPSATASANVAALQAALDAAHAGGGGIVVIDKAGDYLVNAGLVIYAKTRLIFAPGAALSKSGNFAQVIRNNGANTGTVDDDITLEGCRIKVNGIEPYGTTINGMNGHVEFYRVKNLVVRDFQIADIGTLVFGLHICTWQHLYLENLEFHGGKDGVHLGTGSHGHIRNLRGDPGDDLINVGAYDWTPSNPVIGDITDLVIEGMVSDSSHRIMVGAFAEWTNGRQYFSGEAVNADGNVYCYEGMLGTLKTASVMPTHTTPGQVVTGADTIPWRFEFTGPQTEINVRNLTFRDCTFNQEGVLRDTNNTGTGGFSRNVSPGTEGNEEISGLLFENCNFNFATVSGQGALTGQGRVADVTFRNCKFVGPDWGAVIIQNVYLIPAEFASEHDMLMRIENCAFDMEDWISLVSSVDTNWNIEITGTGNTIKTLPYIYTGVGSSFRSNGFDLPVRFDTLTPQHGDRAKLFAPPTHTLSGWLVYGRGRWNYEDPRQVATHNKLLVPSIYASGGGGTPVASEISGGYSKLLAGNAAGSWALVKFDEITTQIPNYLTNFDTPFSLSGEFWGQAAANGGDVDIIYGIHYNLNLFGPFTFGSTNPFTSKGIGIQFSRPGGTGNQLVRIIGHNGTTTVESSWVDLGAPAGQRHYFYELVSNGFGTYQLYLGTAPLYNNRAISVQNTPSATIANGPVGNGSDGNATGIFGIALTDGVNAPSGYNVGGYLGHPTLEYFTF